MEPYHDVIIDYVAANALRFTRCGVLLGVGLKPFHPYFSGLPDYGISRCFFDLLSIVFHCRRKLYVFVQNAPRYEEFAMLIIWSNLDCC